MKTSRLAVLVAPLAALLAAMAADANHYYHTSRTHFGRPGVGPTAPYIRPARPRWSYRLFGFRFVPKTKEEEHTAFLRQYQVAKARYLSDLQRLNWEGYAPEYFQDALPAEQQTAQAEPKQRGNLLALISGEYKVKSKPLANRKDATATATAVAKGKGKTKNSVDAVANAGSKQDARTKVTPVSQPKGPVTQPMPQGAQPLVPPAPSSAGYYPYAVPGGLTPVGHHEYCPQDAGGPYGQAVPQQAPVAHQHAPVAQDGAACPPGKAHKPKGVLGPLAHKVLNRDKCAPRRQIFPFHGHHLGMPNFPNIPNVGYPGFNLPPNAGPYQYPYGYPNPYPAMNREDAVRYIEGFQYYPPYHLMRSPRDFYMFDVKYGIGQ